MAQVIIPLDVPTLDEAMGMVDSLGEAIDFVLHVGDEGKLPELYLPESEKVKWTRVSRTGSPVEGIVATAEDHDVDLVIMTTEGRHGIFDALRGTVTEKVLRELKRPLLAVPAS